MKFIEIKIQKAFEERLFVRILGICFKIYERNFFFKKRKGPVYLRISAVFCISATRLFRTGYFPWRKSNWVATSGRLFGKGRRREKKVRLRASDKSGAQLSKAKVLGAVRAFSRGTFARQKHWATGCRSHGHENSPGLPLSLLLSVFLSPLSVALTSFATSDSIFKYAPTELRSARLRSSRGKSRALAPFSYLPDVFASWRSIRSHSRRKYQHVVRRELSSLKFFLERKSKRTSRKWFLRLK